MKKTWIQLSALGLATLTLLSATPAFADRDDWRSCRGNNWRNGWDNGRKVGWQRKAWRNGWRPVSNWNGPGGGGGWDRWDNRRGGWDRPWRQSRNWFDW